MYVWQARASRLSLFITVSWTKLRNQTVKNVHHSRAPKHIVLNHPSNAGLDRVDANVVDFPDSGEENRTGLEDQ